MLNCTATSVDNSHFSMWMPLIGIYIAGATFVCVIAVAVDLVEGLRTRQYWIPSNWSSLNAVSIAVITAASKLSLDLSTSMPREIDQLSKLSTTAFVCIALANAAPSIGKLENGESFANIAALFICVISSVVGICIQLTNGVIFTFRAAHITMVVAMSVLVFVCVVSSTGITVFKSIYNAMYDAQNKEALKDVEDRRHLTTGKLKQYLERFSMLAHSGCPHFLMARKDGPIHALCGLVAAIAFFINLIACITHKDKFLGPTSHIGTSNYGWSVLYILSSQAIGVGVGTIVLCIRGSYTFAVLSRMAGSTTDQKQKTDTRENYWIQDSGYLAWFPFLPGVEYKQKKWLGYLLKYPFYMACYILKIILWAIYVFLFVYIPTIFWDCIIDVMPVQRHCDEDDRVLEEFIPYFLIYGSEHTQIKRMMKSVIYVSKRCMGAEERETKHLRELLQEFHSDGFERAVKFRIPQISPNSEELVILPPPSHSWSLSVLTLTWIAIALPNIDPNRKEKLRKSVTEGLVYVKLIEDNFNNKHHFANHRFIASLLWLIFSFIFSDRITSLPFFDEDHLPGKTAKGTLESIKDSAGSYITPSRAPYDLVVSYYFYGTSGMILRDCESDPDDSTVVFDKLRGTISGILGACLINLKSYILLECERSSSIEKRREAACEILKLFGETQEIMKILEERQIPEDIPPEEMVHMDRWHQSHHYDHHREAGATDYSRIM